MALEQAATKAIGSMPKLAEGFANFALQKCSLTPEEFRKKAKSVASTTKFNDINRTLVNELRSMISAQITDLFVIERWLTSIRPKIEDGNNFGVQVQQHVIKSVVSSRTTLEGLLDKFAGYYKERGDAVDKAQGSKETVTESKSTSKAKTEGGKADESGDKSSESSSKETKIVTSSNAPADYIEHVIAIDVMWYEIFKRSAMQACISIEGTHGDLSLNMEKVKHPKGKKSGGMTMY